MGIHEFDLELENESKILRSFKLVMYNDNFTTMEFVILVIMKILKKDYEFAQTKMLEIHKNGKAIVDTGEIANLTVRKNKIIDLANINNMPLKVEVEE